jgi:hypothetical protein
MRGADCQTLKDIPLLESRTRPGELDRWLAACSARKVKRDAAKFRAFLYGLRSRVGCGGLLIAPTALTAEDVRNGRLAALEPGTKIQGARLMLLWRKPDEATTMLITHGLAKEGNAASASVLGWQDISGA